ncbi:MAG: hypothetical protein NXI29_14640 [bacterium]|nr:hypothetical protein [bacterium]
MNHLLHLLFDEGDLRQGRGGVKRKLCCGLRVSVPEFSVSCISNALKVLRNDLKMYETVRTGSDCSGEKLEKSTAIQVHLSNLWSVFQCTHRPPRARSTIATLYGSGSGNQVQFVHWKSENRGAKERVPDADLKLGAKKMRPSKEDTDAFQHYEKYVSPGRRNRSVSAQWYSGNPEEQSTT